MGGQSLSELKSMPELKSTCRLLGQKVNGLKFSLNAEVPFKYILGMRYTIVIKIDEPIRIGPLGTNQNAMLEVELEKCICIPSINYNDPILK